MLLEIANTSFQPLDPVYLTRISTSSYLSTRLELLELKIKACETVVKVINKHPFASINRLYESKILLRLI